MKNENEKNTIADGIESMMPFIGRVITLLLIPLALIPQRVRYRLGQVWAIAAFILFLSLVAGTVFIFGSGLLGV